MSMDACTLSEAVRSDPPRGAVTAIAVAATDDDSLRALFRTE